MCSGLGIGTDSLGGWLWLSPLIGIVLFFFEMPKRQQPQYHLLLQWELAPSLDLGELLGTVNRFISVSGLRAVVLCEDFYIFCAREQL